MERASERVMNGDLGRKSERVMDGDLDGKCEKVMGVVERAGG